MVTNLREELRWTRFRLNYAAAVGLAREISDPKTRIVAAERHLVNAVYDGILRKVVSPELDAIKTAAEQAHHILTHPQAALKAAVHRAIRKGLSKTLDLEPAISTLSVPVKLALFVISVIPGLGKSVREVTVEHSEHTYERVR